MVHVQYNNINNINSDYYQYTLIGKKAIPNKLLYLFDFIIDRNAQH